ncbi:MAG TPA: tetratricopeptide repeat protein [Candidatus Paceibacterota bacterium]
MKKTLIIIGFIGLIVGASWFGWSQMAKTPVVNSPQSEATSTVNDIKPAPVSLTEKEKLQQQAIDIINRDILIRVSLSAATEAQAREKIKELSDMIRGNFDYDAPWLDLGSYRRLIGDYDGAREAWEFLAKIRPQSYVVFHNLGDLYAYQFKNYLKGEEYFLKSIANAPGNIQGYIQLATIYQYYDTSKNDKIEPLLLKGITANPKDANLLITLGEYYQDQGRKTEALKYLEEALQLNPKNTSLQQEIEQLKNS